MMRDAPFRNNPIRSAMTCVVVGTLLALPTLFITGCQTFSRASLPFSSARDSATAGAEAQTVQTSYVDSARKTTTQVVNLITLREQENIEKAKEMYQEGDALFRQAESLPEDEAKATFLKASGLFRRASEAAPETAIQQDAMFMQAESLFFADRLVDASEAYGKLQKQFPRNRHNDLITSRLFSISRYWIDVEKANEGKWTTLNLSDHKRPVLDGKGHAIRVLDQIRYDDPTGRLADDATMAAAAEHIRQKKFDKADEFLTDLRETYTDSEHLFLAHVLGIRCKLEIYAGPKYSGLVLAEAEKLVQQTRQRFPDKMADQQYADIVARAAAEIEYHQAERLAYRAEYREKKKEYGAARYYYNELLAKHQDTPHAERARDRLAEIETLPAVPEQRLGWLTTVFPDSRSNVPLEKTFVDKDEQPSNEGTSIFR